MLLSVQDHQIKLAMRPDAMKFQKESNWLFLQVPAQGKTQPQQIQFNLMVFKILLVFLTFPNFSICSEKQFWKNSQILERKGLQTAKNVTPGHIKLETIRCTFDLISSNNEAIADCSPIVGFIIIHVPQLQKNIFQWPKFIQQL